MEKNLRPRENLGLNIQQRKNKKNCDMRHFSKIHSGNVPYTYINLKNLMNANGKNENFITVEFRTY